MPPKSLRHLRDAAIVLAIALGVLVSMELALRIIYPEKIAKAPDKDTIAFEFNEHYLIALKPEVKKFYIRSKENGGDKVLWKTNKDGFRGPELRNNPKYRVMVYGDSNIQARFSILSNTFPSQLSGFLEKSGLRDIEVINAGVVGFGPDQCFMKFSIEADKYKPDLIIFSFFADNDFGDLLRNALFRVDQAGELTKFENRPIVDKFLVINEGSKWNEYLSKLLIVRAAKKAVGILLNSINGSSQSKLNNPEAERRIQIKLLNSLCLSEFQNYQISDGLRVTPFADHYDIDIALDPGQESSIVKLNLAENVLRKARDLADSKGIGFLVLIQPSVKDITTENSTINYKYLQKYQLYRRTNLTGAVERICIANNINYINLFDLFWENNPENLYFRAGDDHWNDSGQQLAARETASYIIKHGMLGAKAPEPK